MVETLAPTFTKDWEAFVSNLRGYVFRRVAQDFADDVLGDIMLRLVQHQQQLAKAGNPTAWMYRVASNAIADHYRRRAVEKRVIDPSKDELPEPVTDTSSDTSATRELAACLKPLIQSLPEPYAQALQMTDIDGITQAAASERLGLSVSGMKSRVQRGRARLKHALLRCCEVELDSNGAVQDYRQRRDHCDC